MAHGSSTWIPVAQLLGTVFVGVGAFLIAYRQWRTAHEKLRYDLFEKKYELFTEIYDKLGSVIQQGDDNITFADATYIEDRLFRIRFLFGKPLWRMASGVTVAMKKLVAISQLGMEQRLNGEIQRKQDLYLDEVVKFQTILPEVAEEHLQFDDIKKSSPWNHIMARVRRLSRHRRFTSQKPTK